MSTSSWIQLDDQRASWIFLVLGEEEKPDSDSRYIAPDPQYWKIGFGNAQSLVKTETAQVGYEGVTSESELVGTLMGELARYRYQDVLLITPKKSTIQYLRRLLMASNQAEPSLRGFSQLDVESQLTDYFGQSLREYELRQFIHQPPRETETEPPQVVDNGSIRSLWELWLQLFKLLPAAEVTGDQL